MNLPNKLTVFRVLLIPVFLVVLFYPGLAPDLQRYWAVAVFIVAASTDALDGYIARSQNLVTNFGKFMDPLADKLLVCAALIAMVAMGDLAAYVVILIISREFMITGFRTLAADQNIVLAASKWGKLKTIFQMLMIIVVLLHLSIPYFSYIEAALIFLAVLFTIVSGVDYIVKNVSVLKEQK